MIDAKALSQRVKVLIQKCFLNITDGRSDPFQMKQASRKSFGVNMKLAMPAFLEARTTGIALNVATYCLLRTKPSFEMLFSFYGTP